MAAVPQGFALEAVPVIHVLFMEECLLNGDYRMQTSDLRPLSPSIAIVQYRRLFAIWDRILGIYGPA